MGRLKYDLTGRTFTRLHVIEEDTAPRPGKSNGIRWKCRCDCGNTVTVYSGSLLSGATKSCGCMRKRLRLVTGLAAEIVREEAIKAIAAPAAPHDQPKKAAPVRWAMPAVFGGRIENLAAPRPRKKVTDQALQGLNEAKQYLAARGSFKY